MIEAARRVRLLTVLISLGACTERVYPKMAEHVMTTCPIECRSDYESDFFFSSPTP
jgi:hypothetical protein